MDSVDITSRTEQALDLLEHALSVLQQGPSDDEFPRAKVARLVSSARTRLMVSADPQATGFVTGVLACNDLLDDALRVAKRAAPSSVQILAASAIERAQEILYFVAFHNSSATPEQKARSLRPPATRPISLRPPIETSPEDATASEPLINLEDYSPEDFEALLRGTQAEPLDEPRASDESDEPEISVQSLAPDALDEPDESDEPEISVQSLAPDALDAELKPSAPPQSVAPAAPEPAHAKRVVLNAKITYDGATNFYLGFQEDISSGGLFVATYDRPPVGTKVVLTFKLPGGHVARALGVVRWNRNVIDPDEDSLPGVGVGFEELSAADRKAVKAFIRFRAPIFYDDEA